MTPGSNSFDTLSTLQVGGTEYHYYSLEKLARQDLEAISRLPFSLKVLLENVLRFERGSDARPAHHGAQPAGRTAVG